MDNKTCIEMCRSLAKAYSVAVRLYDKDNLLFYYSVNNMEIDPLGNHLKEILESKAEAGIITTQLYQFYGFITVDRGKRIILGPTRILQDDTKEIELLMAMLNVSPTYRNDYLKLLYSAPIISGNRLAWLLSSLMMAIHNKVFPVEKVCFQIKKDSEDLKDNDDYSKVDDSELRQKVNQSYAWEQLIVSYVENGQTKLLKELCSAPPKINAGIIAHDALRQIKNMGICAATVASRAAIQGGLDVQTAFKISDLYIQKMELLNDITKVEQLIHQMIIDLASHVEKISHPKGVDSRYYRICCNYVSKHLYSSIKVETMAKDLGYTRAHLCARFKKEAGISLIHYIQKEKIIESKRLLQFTDQSLASIALLLGFCSQSHFQTIFKKIEKETPMEYRRRIRLDN